MKAQAIGLLERIPNFEFIASFIFMKKIMYQVRIAVEKLEVEEINIIDAIEMLCAMMEPFERILEDEINNFIDSEKVFTRMREVDSEADFVRHHRRRL